MKGQKPNNFDGNTETKGQNLRDISCLLCTLLFLQTVNMFYNLNTYPDPV